MEEAKLRHEQRLWAALQTSSLLVLIGREGGSVTIPAQEFLDVAERYGGTLEASMHFEALSDGDTKLVLSRQPLAQGKLMS